MAFSDFSTGNQAVSILQKSIGQGRLAHAYLFTGDQIKVLEEAAANLAKTLNCESGSQIDCCETCLSCRKINQGLYPDVAWIRPESKLRIISIQQIRDLVKTIHLKPTESKWKFFVLCEADRLNTQSANAFLKTLEEPPSQSILILLSTQPDRLLDTIQSRCLRLSFGDNARPSLDEAQDQAVQSFIQSLDQSNPFFGKYKLLGRILDILQSERETIENRLGKASPLEKYTDAETAQKKKWEEELSSAIEAQYRRRRGEILLSLQWWLRDQWMISLNQPASLLFLRTSQDQHTGRKQLKTAQCKKNLDILERTQTILNTNVLESLALEVCFLELDL